MRIGDVKRVGEPSQPFEHARFFERSAVGQQPGGGITARDMKQDRCRFGKALTAIQLQHWNQAPRVDGEIGRLAVLALRQAHDHRLERSPCLLQCDMARHRAGTGRMIEFHEKVFRVSAFSCERWIDGDRAANQDF
jgi:hypothetical protein